MKKFYESVEMEIVIFETKDVVVASGVNVVATETYTQEDNETEVL